MGGKSGSRSREVNAALMTPRETSGFHPAPSMGRQRRAARKPAPDLLQVRRINSKVLVLNRRTRQWRHNSLAFGTNQNRAWFKGMNAVSNWPRNRLLLALP